MSALRITLCRADRGERIRSLTLPWPAARGANGIKGVCRDGKVRWSCGQQAWAALHNLVSGRSLICQPPRALGPGALSADCRVAQDPASAAGRSFRRDAEDVSDRLKCEGSSPPGRKSCCARPLASPGGFSCSSRSPSSGSAAPPSSSNSPIGRRWSRAERPGRDAPAAGARPSAGGKRAFSLAVQRDWRL